MQAEATIAYVPAKGAFRANIIALGVTIIIAATLNALALVVPLLRGAEDRSRHWWVIKTRRTGEYRHPYLVPNGRIFCCAFAIVSCGCEYTTRLSMYRPRA